MRNFTAMCDLLLSSSTQFASKTGYPILFNEMSHSRLQINAAVVDIPLYDQNDDGKDD